MILVRKFISDDCGPECKFMRADCQGAMNFVPPRKKV